MRFMKGVEVRNLCVIIFLESLPAVGRCVIKRAQSSFSELSSFLLFRGSLTKLMLRFMSRKEVRTICTNSWKH